MTGPETGGTSRVALVPTGEMQEALALAWDMYTLQRVNGLPERLMRRMRHGGEFQGARYEVAVAATFIRCGFTVEWNSDTASRGPEFTATNQLTKDSFGVEAKSRRRPGTLNEPGILLEQPSLDTDLRSLVERAVGQHPGDRPFVILIDLNAPNDSPEIAHLLANSVSRIVDNYVAQGFERDPFSLLAITNCGWHYQHNRAISSGARYCAVVGKNAAFPIKNEAAILAVIDELGRLGNVPEDG